jgi:hypothetical protein
MILPQSLEPLLTRKRRAGCWKLFEQKNHGKIVIPGLISAIVAVASGCPPARA